MYAKEECVIYIRLLISKIGAVFSVAMQAGSGLGLAITNAISDAVIHSTGSHLKGYQVGLWIGFAVTLLCVFITLVFVPSKATLEKKRLAKADAAALEASGGDIASVEPGHKQELHEGSFSSETKPDQSGLTSTEVKG